MSTTKAPYINVICNGKPNRPSIIPTKNTFINKYIYIERELTNKQKHEKISKLYFMLEAMKKIIIIK